jgi:FKBP-type peptidyl-prolyl cis-trans isomerase FklB
MGFYTRSLIAIILIIFSFSTGINAQKKKKKKQKSKTEESTITLANKLDTVSYALGMGVAENLKSAGLSSVNLNAFNEGFNQIFNGDSTLLNQADVKLLLSTYFNDLAKKRMEDNIANGKEFLEKNKLRPEVVALPSGLQYEILIEGEGPHPTKNSSVTVHYRGKLLNGTEFDSSIGGQPATFKLNEVIKGWTEGLQLMRSGAKYILFIPPDLAYGERGSGSHVPPNATLIFEVELISIN